MIIGQTNTSTAQTALNRSGGAAATALSIRNAQGAAISAQVDAGSAIGIFSSTVDGPALYGVTASSNDGVYGQSTNGNGVVGVSTGGAGVFGFAVGSIAISGQSTTSTGIRGASVSGAGISGVSQSSFGILGTSTSGKAIFGSSGSNSGIYGQSVSGLAGEFVGAVSVTGEMTVNGNFAATGMKSALVKQSDGSYNRVYCLESPDSLFEDFGAAALNGGRVTVSIARDFMAVARTGEAYLVYLTPDEDCRGLYVSSKSADTFEVRELGGGTSNARFSYRIVARRGDIDAPRSGRVTNVHRGQHIDVDPGQPPRMPARVDLPAGAPPRPDFSAPEGEGERRSR